MDLTGHQYNDLLVMSKASHKLYGETTWVCECVCGRFTEATTHRLTKGIKKSCGCKRGLNTRLKLIHGKSHSLTASCFYSMRNRCNNPNYRWTGYYLGRGIKVCDRWMVGENGKHPLICFIQDMGERPSPKHSIERLDVNGDYTPDNCIWAMPQQQARNTRKTKYFTYKGETKTVIEWSEITGLKYQTLRSRIKVGTPESIIFDSKLPKFWNKCN